MKKTKPIGVIAIIIIIVGLIFIFFGSGDSISEKTGTIQYIDLEGGFYGIIADDGSRYDPVNLMDSFPEFQEDGLRVKFSGNELKDHVSYHMWGTLIELTEIEEIND
jgi:hypothetical protein